MTYAITLAEGSLASALAGVSRTRYTKGMDDRPSPLTLYLTVAEAAAMLDVLPVSVRALLARRRLPGSVKVGRDWLVLRASVEARLRERRETASS